MCRRLHWARFACPAGKRFVLSYYKHHRHLLPNGRNKLVATVCIDQSSGTQFSTVSTEILVVSITTISLWALFYLLKGKNTAVGMEFSPFLWERRFKASFSIDGCSSPHASGQRIAIRFFQKKSDQTSMTWSMKILTIFVSFRSFHNPCSLERNKTSKETTKRNNTNINFLFNSRPATNSIELSA